eukprot:1176782-Prorocentrum_minimum.AAC.3
MSRSLLSSAVSPGGLPWAASPGRLPWVLATTVRLEYAFCRKFCEVPEAGGAGVRGAVVPGTELGLANPKP